MWSREIACSVVCPYSVKYRDTPAPTCQGMPEYPKLLILINRWQLSRNSLPNGNYRPKRRFLNEKLVECTAFARRRPPDIFVRIRVPLRACSSVGLEQGTHNPLVPGSSPGGPTISLLRLIPAVSAAPSANWGPCTAGRAAVRGVVVEFGIRLLRSSAAGPTAQQPLVASARDLLKASVQIFEDRPAIDT